MLDFERFEVLSFDCYGTLIDWETGIVEALRPILGRHSVEPTDDEILELFGELEAEAERPPYRRYREALAAVADGFGRRLAFTPSDAERAAFSGSVAQWPPFADTVEALHALSRHYQLAIPSNVDDDLFAESAKLLKVDFAIVVTAEQVGGYKPDPRNFQHLVDRIGLPREKVLHVAQSLFHDIAPAGTAGLTTVWVNRRHGRPGFGATPPMSAEPDLEVPSLAALARLVQEAHAHPGL